VKGSDSEEEGLIEPPPKRLAAASVVKRRVAGAAPLQVDASARGARARENLAPMALTDDDSGETAEELCEICGRGDDESCMLLCDTCGKGYHIFCLRPPLSAVPDGDWHCPHCVLGRADLEGSGVGEPRTKASAPIAALHRSEPPRRLLSCTAAAVAAASSESSPESAAVAAGSSERRGLRPSRRVKVLGTGAATEGPGVGDHLSPAFARQPVSGSIDIDPSQESDSEERDLASLVPAAAPGGARAASAEARGPGQPRQSRRRPSSQSCRLRSTAASPP